MCMGLPDSGSPLPQTKFVFSLQLRLNRNLSSDKWLMESNRMISVRRSGNGRVEVVDREVSHQENDKLMLLYGKRDEAHYEINELARRGLNLITKDTPGKPPSVFCNDPGHPRNPDLDATVTVTVNDRVKVVPVWENHTCAECPPLCRCGHLNAIGETIVTCESCLKVAPPNHGQGYLNPLRVAVPEVERLDLGKGTSFGPSGSSVGRFQQLAAYFRHQVVKTHDLLSRVSLEQSEAAFRRVSGYDGELDTFERPPEVCFDLCAETRSSRDTRSRMLGSFPTGEQIDTVESLTTAFRNAGILPEADGWGNAGNRGGPGWGHDRPVSTVNVHNSLLECMPLGASNRADGPDYGDAHAFRDMLDTLRSQGHCMSKTLHLEVPALDSLEDVAALNRQLRYYGCQISVPGFRLEMVPSLSYQYVSNRDGPHYFVDGEDYYNGVPLREMISKLRSLLEDMPPPPRDQRDEAGAAVYHAAFHARMLRVLHRHLRDAQVT